MRANAFLDSDVIISSLISKKGASYFLINEIKGKLYISNFSEKELNIVIKRLKLDTNKFEGIIKNKLTKTKIKTNITKIKSEFKKYTKDINDTHIIAGAKKSKTKYLITYNTKHYEIEKIKKEFNILVLTPAQYLQILRNST